MAEVDEETLRGSVCPPKASIRSRRNWRAIIRVALVSSLTKASLDVRSALGLAGGKRRPGANEQLKFAFFGAHFSDVDMNGEAGCAIGPSIQPRRSHKP